MKKVFMLFAAMCSLLFASEQKNITVTYSVLGSLTKELVGDGFNVTVLIPNGQDMHTWKPSAKDIKQLSSANMIVQNGLETEAGLQKAIKQAAKSGAKVFTASNYVKLRALEEDDDDHGHHNHHHHDAKDPHFWLDPISMKSVVLGLSEAIKKDFGTDVSAKANEIAARLDKLSADIAAKTQTIPAQNRKLVTGHDSLGYYAARYNFEVIGAVIPSISTEAKTSAKQVAKLEKLIIKTKILAIFTELGTPKQVSQQISKDTGVKVVELNTHLLPADGSYFTMMGNMSDTITGALK